MSTRNKKVFVFAFAALLVLFVFTSGYAFKTVKFAVITDAHMALYGEDGMKMGASSTKIVENTVTALNKMDDLDFVVVTGDLLLDGEPWNLDLIKSYLDELKAPYYVIAGNHDQAISKQAKPGQAPYVGISKSTLVWAFQGHGYKGGNAYWGADPVSGLHIIGLDSNISTGWGGTIPPSEIRWLEEELSANRDKVNLLFSHHNFVAWCKDDEPGGKFDQFQVNNAAEVRKVLEKYTPSLQLVLTGHRHIGLRHQKVNGVTYIVHPAAVSYPNQYTLYTLTPTSAKYETKWVPIEKEIIETGKANLLKDNWWRPTDATDKQMLEFFEGPGNVLKKGTLQLKPVAVK